MDDDSGGADDDALSLAEILEGLEEMDDDILARQLLAAFDDAHEDDLPRPAA